MSYPRQCSAITKNGKQCQFRADVGHRFCRVHAKATVFKQRRFHCKKHPDGPAAFCLTCVIVARENRELETREKYS